MEIKAYKVLLKDKDGNQLLPRTRQELVEGLTDALTTKLEAADITGKLSAAYDSTNKKLTLTYDGTTISEIDASDFIKDGMVSAVTYNSTAKTITITFNTDAGKDAITVDVSDLVDTYTAGNGLSLSSNKFSVAITSGESYLAADSTGLHTTDALATAISAKQDSLTFDSAPTDGSTNPVTSDGVYDAIKTVSDDVATNAKAITTLQSASVFYTQGAEVTALTE